MGRHKYVLSVVAALPLCTALAFTAQADPLDQGDAAGKAAVDAQTAQLPEIVVTAEKREEKSQNVPISVAVITPELIQSERIQTVADIASYVPNVYVTAQPGGNSIPQYTIRGVAAGNSEPQVDNPVTVYIDGVPLGREVGSLLDLADISRLEVLRGPQGTLFGRNSTGGAVSVITSDPSGKLDLKEELTAGDFNAFRSRTVLNLPEWNNLSLQLTYLHSERDGDVRNLGAGTVWNFTTRSGGVYGDKTAARTLGGEDTNAVRVALEWKPSDSLKVDYKFDYTHSLQSPPATGAIADSLGLLALGGGSVSGLTRPSAVNDWFSSPNDMTVQGHNVTVAYTATDWLTIKDILGYRDYQNKSINQLDGAGGLHDPYGIFGGPAGSPLLLVAIASQNHFRQVSDELQFNFHFSAVDVTSGLMYFRENLKEINFDSAQTIVVSDAPGFLLPGPTEPASTQVNESSAIYAQAVYHVLSQLDFVVGGRETHDHRTDVEPVFNANTSNSTDHFNFLIDLTYRPINDVMTYAKYSTGYVPGGHVGPNSFEAETLDQAELGAKTEFLDRTLQLNAAVFHSWYKNQQFPTFPLGILDVLNAAKAHISGFELEATAIPVKGLTLTANIGYTDFVYDDISAAVRTAVVGSTTAPFLPTYRPKLTAMLATEYDFPRYDWGGQLTARIDSEYRSEYNTQQSGLYPSPVTWLLNGRLALVDLPMGRLKGQVALWGKNITNAKELTYVDNLGVSLAANYEAARSFGVDLTVKY